MGFEARLKKRMKALQHLGRNMANVKAEAIYLENIQKNMDAIHYLYSKAISCEKCPLWKNGCVKYLIEDILRMSGITQGEIK